MHTCHKNHPMNELTPPRSFPAGVSGPVKSSSVVRSGDEYDQRRSSWLCVHASNAVGEGRSARTNASVSSPFSVVPNHEPSVAASMRVCSSLSGLAAGSQ
jgi:hypothetical protein